MIFGMKYSFSCINKLKHLPAARLLLLVFLCGTALPGCKKILDVDSSHTVAEKNMWNTHEDTRSALIGVYGLMRAALADNDAYWMYGELRSGDFAAVQRQDIDAVIKNNLHAPLDMLNSLSNWRRFYAVVNAANLFLEHVSDVKARDPRYSEQNMNVDIAQIRFLRAFAYFYLVRIWGDVPLITTSHDGEFANKARDSQQKVLAFIEQELQAAADGLPYMYSQNDPQQQGNYYNEGGDKWNGILARKLSAYAVMAHVAAWQAKYSYVAAYTKFLLDNVAKENLTFLKTDDLTRSNGFFSGRSGTNPVTNHILAFNFDFANGFNRFKVIYDGGRAKISGFNGELDYKASDDVDVFGRVEIKDYKLATEAQPWNLPKFKLTAGTNLHISNKVNLNGTLVFRGDTKDFTTDPFITGGAATTRVVSLSSFADINAGVEYKATSRVGVFVKVNNLLNGNNQSWLYYPDYGFNIFGGVSYGF